jgi:hypothetical protein
VAALPGSSSRASNAALVAIVGLSVFTTLVVALHLLRPDCDPCARHLSEFAVGEGRALMVAAFVSAGASLFALSYACWLSVTPSISLRLACGLLVVNGLINLGMAAFTTDLSIPGPSGRMEITGAGRVHDALAALHAVIWFLIPFFLVSAIRRDERWRRLVMPATIAAIGEMAFIAVVVALQRSIPGLGQRLWIGAVVTWCALHAIMIRRVVSARTVLGSGATRSPSPRS